MGDLDLDALTLVAGVVLPRPQSFDLSRVSERSASIFDEGNRWFAFALLYFCCISASGMSDRTSVLANKRPLTWDCVSRARRDSNPRPSD